MYPLYPCILFIHLITRLLVVFFLVVPLTTISFLSSDRQGAGRCKASVLHLKMVCHAVQPNYSTAQKALHGLVGARILCNFKGPLDTIIDTSLPCALCTSSVVHSWPPQYPQTSRAHSPKRMCLPMYVRMLCRAMLW